MGFLDRFKPNASTAAQIGAAQTARAGRPDRESSVLESLAAAFGESDPAQLTATPRPVGVVPTRGEPITGDKNENIALGRVNQRWQTGNMYQLYVNQVNKMPDAEVQGIQKSAINHSRYVPYNHIVNGWRIYQNWDPIARFANTMIDMRWSVGHIAPLSNGQFGNIPGTAKMGPYAAPYRTAQLVPRFSTEPATIIPQATR